MQNLSYRIRAVKTLEEDFDRMGIDQEEVLTEEVGSLSEPLCEKRFRRTPKKTRTTRTTATQRRDWRRKKRLPRAKTKAKKRLRKPMVKKRQKLLSQWKERRNIPKKPAGRGGRIRLSLAASNNQRVANLMEEVQEIVTSIESNNQEEVIKAYANAALVADSLADKFLAMGEAIAEAVDDENISEEESSAIEGLADLSEQFEAVAEEAAESAEALFECAEKGVFNEEVETDKVEEHFKGLMGKVLDGCDIYSSLTEDEGDDGPLDEVKGAEKKYPSGGKKAKKDEPKQDHA